MPRSATVAAVVVLLVVAYSLMGLVGGPVPPVGRPVWEGGGGLRLPRWLRPRPTVAGDLVFLRRWAALLAPLWGLVGVAAWMLPDSTFHATTPWTRLGVEISIVFCCLLPDTTTRACAEPG